MVARDAIKEIKRIEENGSQLIVNVRAEAKYRIEAARREIAKMNEQEEQRLEILLNDELESVLARGEEIMNEKREIAKKEAEALSKKAGANLTSAVELVIKEIMSRWQ